MKNKEKYFDELIKESLYGTLCDFVNENNVVNCTFFGKDNCENCYNKISEWLEQDCSILDEKEKEYLKAVIRPWRDKVECITKYRYSDKEEFISIENENRYVNFPLFEKGTLYKGMELDRKYSLEDLGI